MGRQTKVDPVEMFKYCFLGHRADVTASFSIHDPMTREKRTFTLPTYKKTSYRDVARRFGYSTRGVEKMAKKYNWYLQKKYFPLKVMGKLPWNLEWIYK